MIEKPGPIKDRRDKQKPKVCYKCVHKKQYAAEKNDFTISPPPVL
ncbi:hypothetical protein CHCC20348_3017 [Bacillus paralicheniformis]|nr:hypothetical protein CHCC20348_3017 [Bacillus paralicheniformis]